ncbi:MAG: nucleotidyltransferase family protein [Bacteroidota bacterium]|nr:nucleotidyltransferase family protein [Bacteroidota bacterium]
MIFAAGLGTRLRPLTDTMPKALVTFKGRTLLENAIMHLRSAGVTSIIINVHHFASQIIDFLDKHDRFGMDIRISDERDYLLDTGGGLEKAAPFFDDGNPFIVYNVDVISDLNLASVMEYHNREKALATLIVRDRVTSRYFLFNEHNLLCGWTNVKTQEKIFTKQENGALRLLAFSGIQVIDPSIFPLITEKGAFSIIKVYLRLSTSHKILGFVDDKSYWKDAGRSLEDLNKE